MGTKEILSAAVSLIVPLMAMIATTLGIVLQDWRSRRNRLLRRRMVVEEATKQVAFASEWWKASQLVDDPDRQESARTTAAALIGEAAARVAEVPVPPKPRTMSMPRRLLLLYPFTRRAAEVVRVLYFALLALMAHGVGSVLQDFDSQYGHYASTDLTMLAVLGVLAASTRFWAVRVEEHGREATRGRRSTLGQWLLLYRMRNRRARVIKAGFFLMMSGIGCYTRYAVEWVREEPLQLLPEAIFLATLLACAVALSAWARSIDPGAPDEPPGPLRRPLLLFRMRHGGAQLIRLLTYAATTMVMLGLAIQVTEKSDGWGTPKWVDFAGNGLGYLTVLAALSYWAVTLHQGGLPDAPGRLRRLLLLRPFRRRAARAVRSAFFLTAVLAVSDLPGFVFQAGGLTGQTDLIIQFLVEAGLAAGFHAGAVGLERSGPHGKPAEQAPARVPPQSAAPHPGVTPAAETPGGHG